MSNIKQVIVMRKDLNMRKGKMCAQAAHASLMASLEAKDALDMNVQLQFREWMQEGMTKICVGVDSESELLLVYETAKRSGIACALIQDAGHTEFGGVPTFTCCAVGPALNEDVDKITGHLKLL